MKKALFNSFMIGGFTGAAIMWAALHYSAPPLVTVTGVLASRDLTASGEEFLPETYVFSSRIFLIPTDGAYNFVDPEAFGKPISLTGHLGRSCANEQNCYPALYFRKSSSHQLKVLK